MMSKYNKASLKDLKVGDEVEIAFPSFTSGTRDGKVLGRKRDR